MERLWTPWRMEYIRSATVAEEDEGCVLCCLPGAGDDARVWILARGALAYVVLNKYPYNPGHLMVAPFRHVGALEDVRADELADMGELLQRAIAALRAASDPHGFNVGMNLGRAAGAGMPDHLHWHVVPRWGGDTNFMPVLGETRVLPELLDETYAKLAPHF